MTRDEFVEVVDLVKQELLRVGLVELASDESYRRGEGPEAVLPDPREQLLLMLKALDRELALRDRTTFEDAFDRLERNVVGPVPRVARVVPLRRIGAVDDTDEIDLAQTPDLHNLRGLLRSLRDGIVETPFDKGSL